MSGDGNNRLPIFLIGFMGSGKTTLGHAVAARLQCPFADIDAVVEQKTGMTISRYFAVRGEDAFRKMESYALRALARKFEGKRAIIACGGGTPCHGDNLELMKRTGRIVFLDASVDRIVSRLLDAPGQRPLVEASDGPRLRQYVEQTLRQRIPFYSLADSSFSGERLDDQEQITESVDKFIEQYF